MKLIEVEFLEESSQAIFFNVAFKAKKTFWHDGKVVVKRAFLEKWGMPGFSKYSNCFKWADGSVPCNQFNSAFVEEMILKYEQSKK